MKLISTFLLLALVANSTFGLENIITEWETSTGSGTYGVTGVYGIYYGATYVFIQTNSLPNDYSIGPKWSKILFYLRKKYFIYFNVLFLFNIKLRILIMPVLKDLHTSFIELLLIVAQRLRQKWVQSVYGLVILNLML